jgi:hexosaminidase
LGQDRLRLAGPGLAGPGLAGAGLEGAGREGSSHARTGGGSGGTRREGAAALGGRARGHEDGGALSLTGGIRLDLAGLPEERVAPLVRALSDAGVPPGPGAAVFVGRVDGGALPALVAKPGGYRLVIGADGVRAIGFDLDGLCHAVRSFTSLVGPSREPIPPATIDDAPRYEHRGLLLDIARNFLGADAIRAIVEQMAALRLNVLHLHLSDDEGWRLEIPGLPELTEVGGRRGHSPHEEDLLDPQLGSGPYPTTSGSGWLSTGDYIAILRHAAARGIRVIPELDMPGHCRAAVVAMEARYERLRDEGADEEVAGWYRLVDPQDSTRITTVQLYDRTSTLNPGLASTFAFIDHVVGAVALMHRRAGVPLDAWHVGGDEVRNIMRGPDFTDLADPRPGCGLVDLTVQDEPWGRSPAAQALVAEGKVASLTELTTWFVRQVDALVRRHGVRRVYVWHEGVEHAAGVEEYGGPVTVLVWTSTAWGLVEQMGDLRRRGFDVVCCAPDFLYFDFPYEAHPRERGVSWATRAIDGRKVFSLAPDNPAQAAEVAVNRMGQPFATAADPGILPVLGIQAHLWSENIRGPQQVQSMVFPRVIAAAERAWYRADWERTPIAGQWYAGGQTTLVDTDALLADWAEFAATVTDRVLPRLDRAGIAYRVPAPGVRVHPGGIEVNCSNPTLPLQMSHDAGRTWIDIAPGFHAARGVVHVRVLSADRSRRGRSEALHVGPVQPVEGPAQSAHGPVQSAHGAAQSAHGAAQPVEGPAQSAHAPVQSAHGPVQSAHAPVQSAHGPAQPDVGPGAR